MPGKHDTRKLHVTGSAHTGLIYSAILIPGAYSLLTTYCLLPTAYPKPKPNPNPNPSPNPNPDPDLTPNPTPTPTPNQVEPPLAHAAA